MNRRNSSLIRSRLMLIVVVALIVVAGAVWVFGPNAPSRSGRIEPTPTLAAPPKITFTPPADLAALATQFPRLEKLLTNPAVDSVYKEFLVAYESGGVEAAEAMARQRGLLSADDQIRVTLVLDTEDSTALVGELQAIGVIVRGTYRDLIDIGVPLDLIARTAESDNPGAVFDQITQLEHVIGLQLPTPKPNNPALALPDTNIVRVDTDDEHWSNNPSPAKPIAGIFQPGDKVVSEGVDVIGAKVWQDAGYTGQGVKIGILDQGFDGYRDLLGSGLPANVTVESFVPGIPADQTGSSHGAAVAEIIHDVAPDAELYLAHYDGGDVSMGNAVDWLRQQGVVIISHSAGGLAAPMDGTGRDAELVDRVAADGRLWINSAGNAANQHHRGTYTDSNADQIHEFAPDKTTLGFQSNIDGLTQIVLNWDDWVDNGTQDLDLFVLDADGNVIASARNLREGNHPPVEQILYQFDDSRTYFIAIHAVTVDRPLRLDVYIHQTTNLEMADPNSSLATPGDAVGALTIGAVFYRTSELEPFSSRGPTNDGRVKPDLVGPDGVLNDVFAPDRFFGTSAAAPHIAGAAALVWSAYPQATADEVRQYLIANTVDLLDPGVDAATGAGLILLPTPPPPPPTATPVPVSPLVTPEPDKPTFTPAPTRTPQRIVIATPNSPRPRPPIQPPPDDGSNWLGLIAIGLIGAIGLVVAWRMSRRADRGASSPTRSIELAQSACPHCGRTLPNDAVFCSQCGRPVGHAATVTKCSNCGRAVRPGAKHCARCGQAL